MGLKRVILRLLPTSTNDYRRAAARYADETLPAATIAAIEAIPGCLNREQGQLLYYLAAWLTPPGRVVEIGSFLGRSTLWLALGLSGTNGDRVVAIDPHDGHERPEMAVEESDSYGAFLRHIQQAGVREAVEPLREASQVVAKRWNEPIRLLWIDGSHDYEDVLADLEGFARHASPGGFVAMHDTRGERFPGVRKAMLEFFERHRDFTRVVSLRNMTVYRRKDAHLD